MLDKSHEFVPFGTVHCVMIILLALGGIVLILATRRFATPRQAERIAWGIGLFMIVQELLDRGLNHYHGGEPWSQILPLHMCGASVFLTAFLLMTRNRFIYEILYFWSVGAVLAILTPDIRYGFPHILNVTYFTSHGLIVIGVIYVTVLFGYRPTPGSVGRIFALSNVYMLVMFPVNWLLGSNYLFIMHKPEAGTPFDHIGPWPWYILSMEAIAFAAFFLAYSPYLVHDTCAVRARPHGRSGGMAS